MKKRYSIRYLIIVLAAYMLIALAPLPQLEGSTAPSNWAAEDIAYAISIGLTPKQLQTNYTKDITRAEFCSLIVALYEKVTGTTITDRVQFDDTNDLNVTKAAAIKAVSGVGNNLFWPDNSLTREQAAVMLSRLAEVVGQPLPTEHVAFADRHSISSWALEGVGQVQRAGIMGGIGKNLFAPQENYTVEQGIVTILRLYAYLTGETLPSAKGATGQEDPTVDEEIIAEEPEEVTETNTIDQATIDQYIQEVITLVNIERTNAQVAPLDGDSLLHNAAAIRAVELETLYAHERPNGEICYTVLIENDYKYRAFGENIAYGPATPALVMQDWMNSEKRRANILSTNHTKLGVGIHADTKTNRLYWVQLFTD